MKRRFWPFLRFLLDRTRLPASPAPPSPYIMPAKDVPLVTPPPLGTLIDDATLELVEVLGVGGYGVVYRAVDIQSLHCKSYAVKCLVRNTAGQTARQRQLHIREITLHQLACSHQNVISLHRVVEEQEYTYLIMDYAYEGDLFSQILHNSRYLGDDFLIKHVFLQILDAVEHCHSLGIYHRDLKPENVLCFDSGLRVAITDFGLATTEKLSEEFKTGSVYHMSPGKRADFLIAASATIDRSISSQNAKDHLSHRRAPTHPSRTTSGHWLLFF